MRFDVPAEITGECSFIHKRLFGAVKGFVTGGPIGAVGGFVGAGNTGSRPPPPPPRPRPRPGPPGVSRGGGIALPDVRLLSQGGTGKAAGAPIMSANGVSVAPSGFHLNKSDYFLKSGEFVPKGTRLVKNRRRDPLNARALKRAVARVDAGKVWQGKLAEISTKKYTAAGKKKSDVHHHHRKAAKKE